jgi:hypothetical protein
MAALPRLASVLLLVCAGVTRAQSLLPAERVSLDSLAAFRPPTANWRIAGGLAGDPRHEKTLTAREGIGVLVNVPTPNARGHLLTTWEHGDLEVDLEVLVPVGSNSGVYLQGRYEVQLFDSWGVRTPKDADMGGIYHRWDAARGAGNEAFEGHAPRANAARAPGLWQKLHIAFEAPRFDAAGQKTKNARFAKVVLNGFTLHENVEVKGPTRSAAFNDEAPLGPLMIQGDHGPVAIRALAVKRFGGDAIKTEQLRYQLFAGDFDEPADYAKKTPKTEGALEKFSHTAIEKTGKFALVFTGKIVAPKDGDYAFAIEGQGIGRLAIDERAVVLPIGRGTQPGTVRLTAGAHPFRLDFIHNGNNRPAMEVFVEGPGIARQALTARDSAPRMPFNPRQLLVDVKDRVLLQRAFVPFEPRKRLYAAAVGTPAGVHYAYDFETAALLHVWRGAFIDTLEMWDNRGNNQTAKPAGPSLTFSGKPAIALIEYPQNGDWPTDPEPLWSSQGYTLEPDGQPVFLGTLAELKVRDRIAAAAEGRGLTRTIECDGKLSGWSTWVLLAEADTITRQPDGGGWIVGEREWYLDWPKDAAQHPVIRNVRGRQQLAVPLTSATLNRPIRYTIVW